jgi:6-phosphogluconolactonase
MLVAGNMMEMAVRNKDSVSVVPASMSVFRIGSDGKLAFVRKYDLNVGTLNLFWMGIIPLK